MVFCEDGMLYSQTDFRVYMDYNVNFRFPINWWKKIMPVPDSYNGYTKDTDVLEASSSGKIFIIWRNKFLMK